MPRWSWNGDAALGFTDENTVPDKSRVEVLVHEERLESVRKAVHEVASKSEPGQGGRKNRRGESVKGRQD